MYQCINVENHKSKSNLMWVLSVIDDPADSSYTDNYERISPDT